MLIYYACFKALGLSDPAYSSNIEPPLPYLRPVPYWGMKGSFLLLMKDSLRPKGRGCLTQAELL